MRQFFIFVCLVCSTQLQGQQTAITDTLTYARSKTFEKKFEEANKLLEAYNSNNHNLNALLFQAQVLYWMKKNIAANAVYERALTLFPDAPMAKLDYGRFLYQQSKLHKAHQLLKKFLLYENTHQEAITMLAYIDLWTGHIASAKKGTALLEKLNSGNSESENILQQIANYTTPYLKLNGSVFCDDQPLKRLGIEPEAGLYKSWLFSPYVKAAFYRSDVDSIFQSSQIEAGNKIQIVATKTDIEFSAGYFKADNYDGDITWKLKLKQRLASAFSLDVVRQKKTYQYTLSGIKRPFLYDLSEAGMEMNIKNRWQARVAYNNLDFDDGNKVYTAYLWFLIPVIHKNNFSVKTGYAYSYANADKNTFQPKVNQPIPQVLYTPMEGIYNPYFTPNDQTVHSLILSLLIPFSKKLVFSGNLNIGVTAHSNNPYLYVDRNGTGPYFINKGFSTLSYTPVEFSGTIEYKLSRNVVINGNYAYNSLIFFKSHAANLQLKYLFINDKKKK